MPVFFVVNKRTAAEEATLLLAPLYKINEQHHKKTHTQHNKSLARSSCCRPAFLCVCTSAGSMANITGQRDLVHNFFILYLYGTSCGYCVLGLFQTVSE